MRRASRTDSLSRLTFGLARASAAGDPSGASNTGTLATRAAFVQFVASLALIVVLLAPACQRVPPVVVLVIPRPLQHDISLWLDEDVVCVALPPLPPAAVYLTRRCLPMRAIRGLILQSQLADSEAPE